MKLSDLQRILDEAKASLPEGLDPEMRLRIGAHWSDDVVVTVREVFAAPVVGGRVPPVSFPPTPQAGSMTAPINLTNVNPPPLYIQPKMLEIEGK